MSGRSLRIAQVAPPNEPVPPPGYGGTERIVAELVIELIRRGHEVTTFASGDSTIAGRLVATVPRALRPAGIGADPTPYLVESAEAVLRRSGEFDVIHSHLEWTSLLLARACPKPVVTTFHSRLDPPWAPAVVEDPPAGLVAISASQAGFHPEIPWAGIVHNGLTLGGSPFVASPGEDLCFVGRVAPEKGILDAIEIARRAGRRLRIAAKIGARSHELAYYEHVFRPALDGADVEFLGELPGADRDRLIAESRAVLIPSTWPEPFGLVAIEALACGTPVLARPVGALPEIVRDGVDGYLADGVDELAAAVDRVGSLDRRAIRESVIVRFSASRMVDGYEAIYRRLLGEG
jgi:glycosyltransferase involved in cell wall biosynthesis